jgi:uncharacterized membrane protein SirB2
MTQFLSLHPLYFGLGFSNGHLFMAARFLSRVDSNHLWNTLLWSTGILLAPLTLDFTAKFGSWLVYLKLQDLGLWIYFSLYVFARRPATFNSVISNHLLGTPP